MALKETLAGSQQQLVPGGSGEAREHRPKMRLLASPLPVVSAVGMSERLSPMDSNRSIFLTFVASHR